MAHAASLQPRSELAQHFFRDLRMVRRLVKSFSVETDTVLEIGAGSGVLTDALARCGFRVIAIEKDARLFRALRERMIGRTNVECHHSDFLRHPLPSGEYSVVANVPFNITAAVVRRLTLDGHPPLDAYLVLQREAAEKFAGVPSETLISLVLRPEFEISIPRVFRRADFDPVPRVRPALLHIHRLATPLLAGGGLRRYRQFVTGTFGSRDAGTALRRYFTARQVHRLARDHGFVTSARTSSLSFPQWLAIFRFYEHACMGRDPTVSFATYALRQELVQV